MWPLVGFGLFGLLLAYWVLLPDAGDDVAPLSVRRTAPRAAELLLGRTHDASWRCDVPSSGYASTPCVAEAWR